jgi:hypothetical protein
VDWPQILLFLTGACFTYGGIVSLFPTRHYRRGYPKFGLAGKNYHVELDENGFSVSGDSCGWRVLGTEVQLKSEDKRVFMFSAKGTMFMFGKKYLTDEQQERSSWICSYADELKKIQRFSVQSVEPIDDHC